MIKDPKKISFWWSAGNVYEVDFVEWVITRMNTGRSNTNQLGVGVKVSSDWLFAKEVVPKIPYNCKRGQYVLRPYTPIYRSYKAAWARKGEIRKPTLKEVMALQGRK